MKKCLHFVTIKRQDYVEKAENIQCETKGKDRTGSPTGLETPYYGVEQMTYHLRNGGHRVNPKRIRRLLRQMGLSAICPGPHTSKPGKGGEHQVFPYLLKGMSISEPGQVVGTDITYIPMRNGFLYLVAFIDWYSRFALSWELSNTLGTDFCLTALEQVWPQVDVGIINTDQGVQFTFNAFVHAVRANGQTKLSMDGKGRAIDNVFTERLWRSLKYEEVYLKGYTDGQEAWQGIRTYFQQYNTNGEQPQWLFFVPIRVVFQASAFTLLSPFFCPMNGEYLTAPV
ncbi:MAG: IS3 family transposase [Saprospiraceae bacterium]|nr:IS3 family transposase [Saprospiraceae bacterium]